MIDGDSRGSDVIAAIVIIGMLCILALTAKAQDCVDDASDMRLRVEIAQRGWDRWGCWTTARVRSSWSPPTEGSPAEFYILRIHGWGRIMDEIRMYEAVYDTSYITWWSSWTDTLVADVCAVDDQGRQGPWSAPSDTFVIAN